MENEKQFVYDGWFAGMPGDDTAYGLFYDTENSFKPCIKPMEEDEAVELWHTVSEQRAEEVKEEASNVGKYVAVGCGMFIAHKLLKHTGCYSKAKNWVTDKFGKKQEEDIIIPKQ